MGAEKGRLNEQRRRGGAEARRKADLFCKKLPPSTYLNVSTSLRFTLLLSLRTVRLCGPSIRRTDALPRQHVVPQRLDLSARIAVENLRESALPSREELRHPRTSTTKTAGPRGLVAAEMEGRRRDDEDDGDAEHSKRNKTKRHSHGLTPLFFLTHLKRILSCIGEQDTERKPQPRLGSSRATGKLVRNASEEKNVVREVSIRLPDDHRPPLPFMT